LEAFEEFCEGFSFGKVKSFSFCSKAQAQVEHVLSLEELA